MKQSTQGAVRVFSPEGALAGEVADALRDAVEAAPLDGQPKLVIDLAASPLIDSTGCEALLDIRDAVVEVGGAVYLAGLSPLCADTLSATGLSRRFMKFEGVNEAVAQYAR